MTKMDIERPDRVGTGFSEQGRIKGKTGQSRTLEEERYGRRGTNRTRGRGQTASTARRSPELESRAGGRAERRWRLGPVSWGLLCMQCKSSGPCQVEKCVPGQELCRTTVLRVREGREELEVVERGCAHPEKTNRTMSYRVGMQIITLTESVCAFNFCNRPSPGRAPVFPPSHYLECISCASSDMSCERGRDQSLQCHSPGEQCLEVVTHRSREVLELENLPLNGFQCYSCEGNSTHGCSAEETSLIECRGPMNQCLEAMGTNGLGNPSYMIRGCTTASWCQSLHVADAFSLTHLNVSCCTTSGCNNPVRDAQHRKGGAPRPGPAQLSLTITLLMTARMWGGTLLWT
ncbi:urokinase plasminogen activator surface receptor isoform X2 [Tupaia chinensis]|uniref:urokinase plasminogen activator surface receptor isoform X2 n=1 Tax=Tupaia chinensis TaxID=246437 RepID=UPI000FFB53D7|nr:urokinase plasminogen activator surface receptor isoform X2 [Tupaia chinensis]